MEDHPAALRLLRSYTWLESGLDVTHPPSFSPSSHLSCLEGTCTPPSIILQGEQDLDLSTPSVGSKLPGTAVFKDRGGAWSWGDSGNMVN